MVDRFWASARGAASSFVALTAFVVALGACAFKPPVVAPVQAEAKGLTVYFAEPKVAHTDDDCPTRKDAPARAVMRALSKAARDSGYDVVADPSVPVDLVAETQMNLTYCAQYKGTFRGTLAVALKANGRVIDEAQIDGGESDREADEWATLVGNKAIDALNRGNGVVAFARGPRARVASHAPAPAPKAAAREPATNAGQPAAPTPSFLVAAPQPTSYALIIGIEKYRDVPSPTGARADAERFAVLAKQTLGIPEEHIKIAIDDRATRGDLVKHLTWLKTNVKPGGRIYFYFSGHGAPEPSSGTSYLLPYDGDPKALDESAVPLTEVLKQLRETQAKQVLAIVDSCFSGAGGRSVLPAGARPLVRVKEAEVAAQVALLSAASGSEISGPTTDGSGGLFSSYLMRGLGSGEADINGDGQISLKEMLDWVKPRVSRDAQHDHREQNPGLALGSGIANPEEFIVAWGIAKR